MSRNIYESLKWFCAPKDVRPMTGLFLFMASVIPMCFMSVYFNNVIIDNRILNENQMFKMMNEAKAFLNHLKKKVSGHSLLHHYQWLEHFGVLVGSHCHVIPDRLRYLRCTGYVMAAYNTLLMHILLSGILPVSFLVCIQIITSFLSGYIDPSKIILLGLFEFSQALLTMVIITMFFILNDRRTRFPAIVGADHEQ